MSYSLEAHDAAQPDQLREAIILIGLDPTDKPFAPIFANLFTMDDVTAALQLITAKQEDIVEKAKAATGEEKVLRESSVAAALDAMKKAENFWLDLLDDVFDLSHKGNNA